ncbi:MAG: molybdopterin-dependent oxidoreductase [Actinomycetota bacterium]|nr:molybdopterin-dependent oxidoreductase [Ilumatobacteraceae bacterium]MDA2959151.1 molybdopterin-dependent oxidoreductase [Actinomycetota bacterium]MDA3007997.1 molybdopterin-dependent oxidoreductase [Actinomycetota bacterium]MDA3035534.1 molybdopterin-dependent oxidoreductase [Actinomycetota bacterium]
MSVTEPRFNESTASTIGFRVNGTPVTVRGTHEHLLSALRDELDITSPKDGCSPSGQCGCCTVLVDGKARVACQTPLERVAGTEVTTLEGLDDHRRDEIAGAFAAHGALQCGFCTPGIVMRTVAMLDKTTDGDLTRDRAARLLGAHLCRCTGYVKILDAIESLASGDVPVAVRPGGVGTAGVKYEARDLTLGERDFIDDMRVDGLLHGAVHLADYARADIISIDTSAAESVEGVVRVFTAADVPGELRSGLIHKDWPVFIPVGGRTSYLGDVLALVVATDRVTARRAAQLIEVGYAPLEPITDPVRALDAEDAVWGLEGNRLSTSAYVRGDVDAGLAAATHVVSERFQTQRIDHAFVEPESTLAVPVSAGQPLPLTGSVTGGDPSDERRLMVYSGGQGIWDDRNDIARMLDIDSTRVITELVSNGGAFGGKEDMSNQGQTALAAWLLDRPVRTTFSREESLLVHTKRHPIQMEYTAGCDAEGHLLALRVRMLGDSGPYASVGMKVLERAAGHASGPYVVQAIDVEAIAVRTNNPVCGAFRGFGANQAQFAMEGVMDRLATMAGISGWEMRSRNVVEPGVVWGPGQIMDGGSAGARACLDAVRPAYDEARAAGYAVGVGLGLKNSGLGNGFKEVARAVVHLRADGILEVRHCWTEMGQGVHTVAAQVAVSELGVNPDQVRVIVDSTRELGAGQTTGSRGTLMGAGAVADACRRALADGLRVGVDYDGEYRVDWTNSLSEGLENPVIHSTFGYAAQMVVMDRDSGEIVNVVAAHDVGRAVNPLLCEGQIEGSVHMGLGYALSEGFPVDADGRPLNDTLRALDIIRPKDMPPVEVMLVESPQPDAPYGIKGVGEIGLVPTSGAVAAAMHDRDGEWRNELPLVNTANRERSTAWN